MENTILVLKTYVDGGIGDTLFPNTESPIEIGAFRYDAKRMGGAPIITASVNYPSCLDDEWTDKVYAEFRGEKYYLKQTPTSSYNNESSLYKHDLELVSERIILDNVYFFDAVVGNPQESDKPVSNSTTVHFSGDIHAFAERMNASLEYANLLKWENGTPIGYHVVVDDNIVTDDKFISFEDRFFSNALQEIYNTYEVPYYFDGKTIHIGFANDSVVLPTFSYGVDDALLSITKNNANFKVVNRAFATGSSDNIPYYYPNNSPKGVLGVAVATSSDDFSVRITDMKKFSDSVDIDSEIKATEAQLNILSAKLNNEDYTLGQRPQAAIKIQSSTVYNDSLHLVSNVTNAGIARFNLHLFVDTKQDANNIEVKIITGGKVINPSEISGNTITFVFDLPLKKVGEATTFIDINMRMKGNGFLSTTRGYGVSVEPCVGWIYKDEVVDISTLGLSSEGTPLVGDTITQKLVEYINTSQNLMPYKYRETKGMERFYNATNGTYENTTFNNPYIEGHPKEHIFEVSDIKPTIKETINSMGLRMDMFSEFAYDLDDNDETEENEDGTDRDYIHSYFFGKLRKLDFNLFEHAIEHQPMTISFTIGACGACNFEIGATEEFPQKNPVLVNEDGSLKRDENGRVICGQFEEIAEDEIQAIQQDTINNEVWIALKKEEKTYGILMPKAPTKNDQGVEIGDHRPKACTEGQNDGDTFVLLGVNLPESYIISAEKKLESEIIKYLKENNDEKFTFSITFSRIYFEENPDVLNYLNENSRINVTYNGKTYLLYVTSFSYSMGEGDVLPEIRVDLDEALTVSQNAIQNAINSVKSEVGKALSNIDVLALANPYFLRKDIDDVVNGTPNFVKGLKFGEGGKVEVVDNTSTKLTIEYLEVTKKASFTSLEVKEKTHVGGQIIISPAAMTCGEVEELEDAYRCYFQTKNPDGNDEIFNQFTENDLAICQTYNAWGSRYYWRKVVGVGEDYIDLSKTLCDELSDIPMAGDKIVQLGNTDDQTRQSAQVLSAYGEDAPSFIMYNGINNFSLDDKNITGIIWNPTTEEPQMYSYGSFFFGDRNLQDNFITFQQKEGDSKKKLYINADITIGPNSSGLSNLSEWASAETKINNAEKKAEDASSEASQASATAQSAASTATSAHSLAETANTNAASASTAAGEAKEAASDATSVANEAKTAVEEINTSVSDLDTKIENIASGVEESIQEINARLDGVVENYFEEGAPSLTNKPVTEWQTDLEKINHVGDTYTNIQEYVDDTTTPDAGKSWRWCWCEDSSIADKVEVTDKDGVKRYLHWHPIADSDAVKALLEASKAQTAADGKSKTFVSQPVPPYKKGDLWTTEDGELMICNSDRTSGSFSSDDWIVATKYTDDSALETFINGDFKKYKDQVDGKIDTYYEGTDPSSSWNTNDEKQSHKGDLWFTNGESKVWSGSEWVLVEGVPQELYDTLDDKKQVFTSQPTPPYYIGDLWAGGDSSDLMVCKNTKIEGNYDASDWKKATKYTDDTKANEAQETANAAKTTLDELTADGVITPFEYEFFFTEYVTVGHDKAKIQYDVERYHLEDSAEWTNYEMYADLYLETLLPIQNKENLPMPVPQNLIWHRNAYYGSRTVILALIAATAKAEVENAQSTADGANALAQAAQNAANAASNAVGMLNDDGYITLIEKRSLRTIAKKISSYEGTSLPYLGTSTYTGEIHDWISVAEQKKDNSVTALVQEAYNAAGAVILWLYGPMGISRDATTDVSAIEGVRKILETRLTTYYTAINVLVNSVPVSDYEYLKAALGNAASLDVEGVVLSQMMGVKDKDNKVRALLNGSEVGKDATCGKLMLAAGIPTDGTIENKISEATTRIYEDGCVYSKNMHLQEGCTIGPFTINEYAIKVDGCITKGAGSTTSMSKYGFSTMGTYQSNYCAIKRRVDIDATQNTTALIYAETEYSSERAFLAKKGKFAGLRTETLVISSKGTSSNPNFLSELDFSVLVPATSGEYYLELPDVPLDGQEYWLETFGADVHVSSTKQMWSHSAGKYETSHEFASRGTIRFKYYAEAEIWTYTWVESI